MECDHLPKVGKGLCRVCYGKVWREQQKSLRIDERPTLECLRCGHKWKRKFWDRDPKHCQRCKTWLWNTPRVNAPWGESFNILLEMLTIETDECVEWPHARLASGYGNVYHNGVNLRAHVTSWEIANKRPVTEGIEVCHTCDNPPCINYRHLFLGTHFENMEDAMRKGRMPRGERNYQAKLTEAQVIQIRSMKEVTLQEMAGRFGVNQTTIYNVRSGKAWKHLL